MTTPKIQAKRKYTKHECDYQCDRPRCIKRQRDELAVQVGALSEQVRNATVIIGAMQSKIDKLKTELAEQNTSRHWILRKLGL